MTTHDQLSGRSGGTSPVALTVGETMALLDCRDDGPPGYGAPLVLRMAGAESNTAIGLQRLGVATRWISRVGNDVLGELIVQTAAREGVDVSAVTRDPARSTGIFMKWRERGRTQREYFRRHSAAAALGPGDLGAEPGEDVAWVHLTGITLGLAASGKELVQLLVRRARKRGIPVSFDLNYRPGLWDSAATAAATATLVLPWVDWVLCGVDEGKELFEVADPTTLGRTLRAAGAGGAVVRVGIDGAWLVGEDAELVPIDALEAEVMDEVGAGDAFAAGFIAGMLRGRGPMQSVSLAHSLAARALRGTGDWETLPTAAELA